MNGIAIYVEGGGQKAERNTAEAKAEFRHGMSAFLDGLREQARRRAWRWKVVPCGDRGSAAAAFMNARRQDPETYAILLVDSETVVKSSAIQHLVVQDKWDLTGVDAEHVHLMAVVMETWLVADPEKVGAFYGQGFNASALPKHSQPESVDKAAIQAGLTAATKATTKGPYRKLRHGSELLGRIDPGAVRARCPHCERLFQSVGNLLPT